MESSPEGEPIGWYTELSVAFQDGTKQRFEIERKITGTHIPQIRGAPAPWAKLGYQKCPCCPIPGEAGTCPAAISLQTTLQRFKNRSSTEVVTATAVDDTGRQQTVTWPLQLVGAVMVQLAVFASECPVGRRVKPHLTGLSPFIPTDELLKHLLRSLIGKDESPETTQKILKETIQPLHQVFVYLFRRLSGLAGAANEDAIPNSIVHVDALAQMMAFRAGRLNDQVTSELGWKKQKEGAKPPQDPGVMEKLKGFFGK